MRFFFSLTAEPQNLDAEKFSCNKVDLKQHDLLSIIQPHTGIYLFLSRILSMLILSFSWSRIVSSISTTIRFSGGEADGSLLETLRTVLS